MVVMIPKSEQGQTGCISVRLGISANNAQLEIAIAAEYDHPKNMLAMMRAYPPYNHRRYKM